MDWMFDERTKCWSVMTALPVDEYINLVKDAHEAQGSLNGQRAVLTTTTAKRIRERMVEDLSKGAILPPVVIGAVLAKDAYDALPTQTASTTSELLGGAPPLSIIDGMQRTAALIEAVKENPAVGSSRQRIEFWLTDNVRAMIYRMLILNTAQVPWTISRQLSVVFSPLLDEIVRSVPELDKMSTPDRPGRRVGPAQYSSDALVELYIAFSLRKTAVDTKEAISDEFSRLDFVDNLADPGFQEQFYGALKMLSKLDRAFSRAQGDETHPSGRFVFDRQPARIGFMVSVGLAVLGRPGADRPLEERDDVLAELSTAQDGLTDRIDLLEPDQLNDFLRLDVLSEVLDKRVGQVGRYERNVFVEAFKVLIEDRFNVSNMESCWRAS